MNSTDAPIAETLVELLRYRARIAPDRRIFSFLPDDASAEELGLTHLQLDRRARSIAAQLQERNAAGERVLLLYPPGLAYISAFFGCLYAGAIAVPTYPPRRERDLPRIEALVADSGARFAVTTEKIFATIQPATEPRRAGPATGALDSNRRDSRTIKRNLARTLAVGPDDRVPAIYLRLDRGSARRGPHARQRPFQRRPHPALFRNQSGIARRLPGHVYPAKKLADTLSLITAGRVPSGTQIDLDGSPLCPFPFDQQFAQFDLSLMITESSTALSATFEYNVALFDRPTIDRMAGHFQTLLKSALSSPDDPVALLPMLTAAQQRQLMQSAGTSLPAQPPTAPQKTNLATVDFSLFYFSCNENDLANEKYRLLLEGARFADQAGITAVWTPERHFHAFGGLYPNPSVLGSALAMITRNLRIRAGSVVLPLHHPLRVAEEWAVVDNLSNGRVDLAFATGWNATDFILAPERHADRKQLLLTNVETVKKLWRGDTVSLPDGAGAITPVRVHPLPIQNELPVWITCVASRESFITAGALGANVLTALLMQSVEDLAQRIAQYREARKSHGHDPDAGQVTLMLHTLVGTDLEEVRAQVRQPFMDYLRSSAELWAHSEKRLEDLTDQEREDLLAYAFERYCRTSTLFGTPESCAPRIEQLRAIGVNEIACLIDFGVDAQTVLSSLKSLDILRKQFDAAPDSSPHPPRHPTMTIHALIESQAEKTPHSIAVVFEGVTITYHELNSRANQIACRLQDLNATVILDCWPLTPNGKLDIAALPQPQRPQSASTPRAAPHTKLEQEIAAIWQETLRVERVGLEENFFDLGGHSLLLAQVHSRLRDRLHLNVSMLDLFRHPTVASLAASIAQGADNSARVEKLHTRQRRVRT